MLIKSDSITSEDRDAIIEWYTELHDCYDEYILWIGYPKSPSHLRQKFYCYENFEELVYILPMRTVQRHIATLQAAGEWIEYDTKKRGWQLQYGVSILFGDHLKDID